MSIIEVQNLKKYYKEFEAVRGVNFEVLQGEVFGLLGPNGAGKTTIVEILEGLRKPSSGDAIIHGLNINTDAKAIKKIIGVQLQSVNFFEMLSLYEIVELFALLYETEVDPLQILDRVGLLEKQQARFKELSGGQQQRLSIAVALVNDPVILFFDEPTTGLDPQARRNMWELIQSFQKDGKTIMLTTHYMEEAETLCNRVAIIDEGQIIKIDTPAHLIDELMQSGFESDREIRGATLEDVFISLTGKSLRED
tara:strand:+ start:8246 stop:9001 length:756 start_codon:yes stop_codon:yes gene_type:complete